MWPDTCVQSGSHPGFISNACGFFWGLACSREGIYMPPWNQRQFPISHRGIWGWCVLMGGGTYGFQA